MPWRKWLRRIWVTAGLAFCLWFVYGFQAIGGEQVFLESGAKVLVVKGEDAVEFRPVGTAARKGLIFLPGGMVAPGAYARLLHGLAEEGHQAILVNLPWRAAFTESQRQELFAVISRILLSGGEWVLSGHSRGAMLAARYVHEKKFLPSGLALIGTTHPRDFDLSSLSIPVTKIYGTLDGIAAYSAMQANARLLPAGTKWVAIEGGNHVQFANYRYQLGDNSAAISREEQQKQLKAALLQALRI